MMSHEVTIDVRKLIEENSRLNRELSVSITKQCEMAGELAKLRSAFVRESHEIEQTLGKALGYPPLYPDASTVDDGSVCVGDHVAVTLAKEAAERIARQAERADRLNERIDVLEQLLQENRQRRIEMAGLEQSCEQLKADNKRLSETAENQRESVREAKSAVIAAANEMARLREESDGRKRALLAVGEERRAEWMRAERAEARAERLAKELYDVIVDNRFWIVGKVTNWRSPTDVAWEFQGVYATEDEAILRCEDYRWYVAPVTVGERIPTEPHPHPGCYFPRPDMPIKPPAARPQSATPTPLDREAEKHDSPQPHEATMRQAMADYDAGRSRPLAEVIGTHRIAIGLGHDCFRL